MCHVLTRRRCEQLLRSNEVLADACGAHFATGAAERSQSSLLPLNPWRATRAANEERLPKKQPPLNPSRRRKWKKRIHDAEIPPLHRFLFEATLGHARHERRCDTLVDSKQEQGGEKLGAYGFARSSAAVVCAVCDGPNLSDDPVVFRIHCGKESQRTPSFVFGSIANTATDKLDDQEQPVQTQTAVMERDRR